MPYENEQDADAGFKRAQGFHVNRRGHARNHVKLDTGGEDRAALKPAAGR